jgi:outer membrane protein OmpA-like peptidoglycan-associated protein
MIRLQHILGLTGSAAILVLTGCATLFTSRAPQLDLAVNTDSAAVLNATGERIGAPPQIRLPPTSRRVLQITAPSHDTATVIIGRRLKRVALLNLINPIGWIIDFSTGAAWTHTPQSATVELTQNVVTPEPPLPDPAWDHPIQAEILRQFALEMERSGCDSSIVRLWEMDRERYLDEEGAAAPLPDTLRDVITEAINARRQDIVTLCAAPSSLALRMREHRLESNEGTPAVDGEIAPLTAPVYFSFGEWRIVDPRDSQRLRDLGRSLASLAEGPLPVTIVVTGFADSVGSSLKNRELGFQRALEVIRLLRDGSGLPANCCIADSYGEEMRFQLAPGKSGRSPDALKNRRVEFSLDFPEEGL